MNALSSRIPRSYLFVPGNRSERFDKALAPGGDAVILDLEDAVAPYDKETARESMLRWLQRCASIYIRINAADICWVEADVAAIASHEAVAVVVPKAADLDVLRYVDTHAHQSLKILPLIESARGFAAMGSIAAQARVSRLLFGTTDFQVDTGIEGDGDELSYFRSQMTIASRLAGIDAPVDGVTTSIDDEEIIRTDMQRARRYGFSGKLCIHPRQLSAIHTALMPSSSDVEWARRVVEVTQAHGRSAVAIDGEMVDAPIIEKAIRILAASS
jgi:citrate lyase subunit beta/citryl-CoA lyase